MNYNYLRYFSTLAEVEHYTIAAARLGISQPSLSSAIHSLENDLGGIKLFEKVGRNIRLTEEGRYYREKVDSALQELHSAFVTLQDSRISAPIVIRMGFVSGILNGIVAQEIAECARQNNRIRFHLTESSSEDLMDMMRQEKLDMALVDSTGRDRSLHFRKLCQLELYAALPSSHPLASRDCIDPKEIIDEPQIAFDYNMAKSFKEWASGLSSDGDVICTVDTAQAALDLVETGIGVAFIPSTCLREHVGVSFVPLKNWHQAIYMCILYDKWLEPPVWDFSRRIVRALRMLNKDNV